MTRVILIHHHIFKNAGTSFNYALRQYFQEQFLEYDLPNSRVVTSARLAQFIREHPQALAISGHHIAMPTPQGPNYQILSSVLLRQPLARVRSIYEFEKRQQARTEGSMRAKSLSFRDYVQWRLDKMPAMLSNYQTQYCARVKDLGAAYVATAQDLEMALENLKHCAMVGTVERYDEFLELVQRYLGQIYPNLVLESTRLNVTAAQVPQGSQAPQKSLNADQQLKTTLIEDLGPELYCILEQNNQLDQKLYAAANKLLTAQVTDWTIDRSGCSQSRTVTTATNQAWGMTRFRKFLSLWLKI